MGALELRDGGGRERLDRGFGDAAIAPARLQRIAAPDDLRAQGEAAVVHPLAHPVEQRLIILPLLQPCELGGQYPDRRRRVEGGGEIGRASCRERRCQYV